MVTLYGSGPAYGVSDLSPFVVKVATYLRLAGLPYEQRAADPRKAPKKKIPYLRDGDLVVSDSSAIVGHLGARHRDLDVGMSARERAVATAVKAMLEEHYYFCIMYQRWQDDRGWGVHEGVFASHLRTATPVPGLLVPLVVRQVRKQALRALDAQGTGRHAVAEVEALARAHLDAVAELMGDGDYFFGAAPRSLDATVWAFLACTSGFTAESGLTDHLRAMPKLVAYVDRVRARCWRDG